METLTKTPAHGQAHPTEPDVRWCATCEDYRRVRPLECSGDCDLSCSDPCVVEGHCPGGKACTLTVCTGCGEDI